MMRSLGPQPKEPEQDAADGGEFDLDADAATAPAMAPPEPDTAELIVRATHVEGPAQEDTGLGGIDAEPTPLEVHGSAPAQEAAQRPEDEVDSQPPPAADPDEDEDEDIAGVARTDVAELTPQGRLRDAVTDDPTSSGRCPTRASC